MRLTILILILNCTSALAYPNFISKGYHACLTCHYNPFGNGPLNDYGRAVSASAISDRLFISNDTTDELLAERSGFLFSKPSQEYIRPSLDYRGMQLDQGIDQDKPTRRFIHMQMDATLTAKFGKANNYIATFTHGIVPDNSARIIEGKKEELNYAREYYIGYRPLPEIGVYFGKMDKIFGIRIPDHNLFHKSKGNLNQYSSSKGAMLHWGKKSFDFGIQYFNGIEDTEKTRAEETIGYTSKFEYSVADNLRIGFSFLDEKDADDNKKNMSALSLKARVGKASSIMIEAGQINDSKTVSGKKSSQYLFMQNHLNIKRGLNFLFTYQYFQDDTKTNSEVFTFAPGLQYYPWQRVELRTEIQNQRSIDDNQDTPVIQDSWSLLSQVHLWF